MRLGVALGLVLIPHRDTPALGGLSYTAGVARLLAGWRSAVVELLAGPFVSPYTVGGVSEHSGILAGAGVAARLTPALSTRLRLVVGVRADGRRRGRVSARSWLGPGKAWNRCCPSGASRLCW
jgi:hypothetical protein